MYPPVPPTWQSCSASTMELLLVLHDPGNDWLYLAYPPTRRSYSELVLVLWKSACMMKFADSAIVAETLIVSMPFPVGPNVLSRVPAGRLPLAAVVSRANAILFPVPSAPAKTMNWVLCCSMVIEFTWPVWERTSKPPPPLGPNAVSGKPVATSRRVTQNFPLAVPAT